MATVSYTARKADENDRSVYSFTDVSFGAEASDRKIIVWCVGRDNTTTDVTAVSIGGVSATITSLGDVGFGNFQDITVASADVPTGTSGTITVTHNSTRDDCTIFVFRTTGITSNTPVDTSTGTGDPASVDVINSRDNVVVGLALVNDLSGASFTWGGLTENYDGSTASGYETSVASSALTGVDTAYTVTAEDTTDNNTVWLALASFPAYSQFTNPGNVYSSNDSYATCAATSGDLVIDLSIDGGETYGNALTKTFTGTEGSQTYGNGSTELWGLAPTRASMTNTNFRLRITHGAYSQVYSGFGFTTGTDLLTGIEVSVEAKYASSTISVDHIKVKIYYGTSTLPIQAGSMAYASNGRKAGEGAGAGTGVLVFNDGSSWIACDTGATVAA